MIQGLLDQPRFCHGLAVAILMVLTAGTIQADELQLRDGTVLTGRYLGGTSDAVRFQSSIGETKINRASIKTLTFEAAASPAPQPTPQAVTQPEPAAVTPARPTQATIPAGTLVLAQMTSQVSSGDSAGRRFSAKLAGNLNDANGAVALAAGMTVYGRVGESKQAGRMVGKSKLALSLTELDVGGKLVPIMTTDFSETGKSSFRKTARNAAMGAAIGAAIDGGDGAATGAAIGGATAIIRKGDSITVPVGAVLEFRLTQPLTLVIGG